MSMSWVIFWLILFIVIAAVVIILVFTLYDGSSDKCPKDQTPATCYSSTTPKDTKEQICTDGSFVCPENFFICEPEKVITCASSSDNIPQDQSSKLDNAVCTQDNQWACKSPNFCVVPDGTKFAGCSNSGGSVQAEVCINGDWQCPSGSCTNEDSKMCMWFDRNNDELSLDSPVCKDTATNTLDCENSSAILCPLEHYSDNPVPYCYSWNPDAFVTSNKSQQEEPGAYEAACPSWNEDKKRYECDEYYYWGTKRPPVNFNPNILVSPTPPAGSPYFPGVRGVVSEDPKKYDPSKGTLAWCQKESGSFCSSENGLTSCLGGWFPTEGTARTIPECDQESRTTTGFRTVSTKDAAYFYEMMQHDGNSFCGGTQTLVTDNEDATSVPEADSQDLCRKSCADKDSCYMYTYKSGADNTEEGDCNIFSWSKANASGTGRFLRQLPSS